MMEPIELALQERFERIVVQNEMLRAGFAALPYIVLKDTRMTLGARLSYAILLSYAWQRGSCFPGQARMAGDMGIGQRSLRRFLAELRDHGYINWRKMMPGGTNTYYLLDVKSKLRKVAARQKNRGNEATGGLSMGPSVASQWGHARPTNRLSRRRLKEKDSVSEK